MSLVYMICTAMCGNGCRTVGTIPTMVRLPMAVPRKRVIAHALLGMADPGSINLSVCVRRCVTGVTELSATEMTAFVLLRVNDARNL